MNFLAKPILSQPISYRYKFGCFDVLLSLGTSLLILDNTIPSKSSQLSYLFAVSYTTTYHVSSFLFMILELASFLCLNPLCLKWLFWGHLKQQVWVLVCVLVTQSCLTATPQTVAYQASLSMEFSRQEYWSGLPFPRPGDLPIQGLNSGLLNCRQIFYSLSHQRNLWVLRYLH